MFSSQSVRPMETTAKKTLKQLKSEKFVITNVNGRASFPKIDTGLRSEKLLTSSIGETYIFDSRDNPEQKVAYYNALYRSVGVQFTTFHF